MRVAVIGGGPSGLVTLKYLLTAHGFLGTEPIEAKLFEAEPDIGGTFLARTYEDAELVSSKQLTTFSDLRLSDDEPDFLSAKRYIRYLKDYASKFSLWPHIHLSTMVRSIRRTPSGKHLVTYVPDATGESQTWECDAIAVCSGLHVIPNIPHIRGVNKVPVTMHSSQFKERRQFGVDKTVLVLGSGETGSDVAYLAVTAPTKRVVICHRTGFHFAPKRNLNPVILPLLGGKHKPQDTVPLDNARASLFDTSYVHPILRNGSALWTFYDIYVKSILWLNTGTPGGLDQLVGEPSAEKNHVSKIFFNKSSKSAPYISAPYRATRHRSIIDRVRSSLIQSPIVDTKGKVIDLAPWPDFIDENGILHFTNNGRLEWERMKDEKIKPDVIVFCTGYKQEFPFFTDSDPDTPYQTHPYPSASDADVRNIWKSDDPTVAFIGFVRPSLGAIPPLSEFQAQLWILKLVAPARISQPLLPRDEPHYRLHHPKGSRIHYGVDHESYAYQLALDMDAAPGIVEVLGRSWGMTMRGKQGWKLPITWALGANYNTKFRLRGPWKSPEFAEDMMVSEVWTMVMRRRLFFDHFMLSILPMAIFGPLNILAFLYAGIAGLFGIEWRTATAYTTIF